MTIKAIILAAGRGTRLFPYTKDLPKGMLNLNGKTIIQRQIELFRKYDITNIIIVTGHYAAKIKYEGVKYFHNENYTNTNMVNTLFCAEDILFGNVIITYADIIFSEQILKSLIDFKNSIGVAVDKNWKNYWMVRYGKINHDTESLLIKNNKIVNLGIPDCKPNDCYSQYICLIRLNKVGSEILKNQYYNSMKSRSNIILQSKNDFNNMYMTDLLMLIINSGEIIEPISVNNGWLEFDTVDDYELFINQNTMLKHKLNFSNLD